MATRREVRRALDMNVVSSGLQPAVVGLGSCPNASGKGSCTLYMIYIDRDPV